MRVLVTGGSGFLGAHVLPLLIKRDHEVTALARSSDAVKRVGRLGAVPIVGDLDDPMSLDSAFTASGAEALVNLASLGFGHADAIVSAAEDAGLKRAVFVSTTAIFTALDARSRSVRMAAEASIKDSLLEWTIVRPTMIYGTPADRNMWRLLRFLRWCPVVPIPGTGARLQQPVHVDDLAGAIVSALDVPTTVGRAYDIAGPEPLMFREVVQQASAAAGRRVVLLPVPLRPAIVTLRLYERAARRPRLKAEQVERLAEDKAFDIEAARTDLGYRPRAFADGIRAELTMRS